MTFGLVKSTDNGATWRWMCEDAVGYGGLYDPIYDFTSTGALFATTFDGLRVNRDGCVFDLSVLAPVPPPTPAPIKFFSTIALGSDGAVYAAAADISDGKIYKSTDNGMTFPTSAMPGMINDWWQTIAVAPSNPSIVYLSGYRLQAPNPKVFLLFRSTNGGTSFQPLPVTDFVAMPGTCQGLPGAMCNGGMPNGVCDVGENATNCRADCVAQTCPNATIEIAGVSATDPNLVYARVTLEDNVVSDAIYKSTNGGQSWTRVLGLAGAIAFVARSNGDLVAGTQNKGSFKSVNQGGTWLPLSGAPHINCLAESSAGEVWACTQNYDVAPIPTDGFGIMKSTDLVSWTGMLKFQNLLEPETCPAGTPQKDKCDTQLWCGLCAQLGCGRKRNCLTDQPDMTVVVTPPPKGCCQTGEGGIPGALVLGLAISVVLLRRRR